MAGPALKIEGLWKQYTLGELGGPDTLYEVLGNLMRRKPVAATTNEPFWALRDVHLEVQPGEVVGVIGRNGAGKSTLLKVLSRITAPTRGRVEVRGRLASLLEVGTGFHPELSGRENIFLNGAILGMRRREVQRKFDEILAFAEVEQFVDTPVKRYSSGMYVRLAFAVAAFLDVDVLVVDEVLAVGDAAFQEKCLSKMEDVSSNGRTVVFVSHNLTAVSRLCSRGLLLHRGQVTCDGPIDDALRQYTHSVASAQRLDMRDFAGTLGERLVLDGFEINESEDRNTVVCLPEEAVTIAVRGRAMDMIPGLRLFISVRARGQNVITLFDTDQPRDHPAGDIEARFHLPPFMLSPQSYTIGVGAFSTARGDWMLDEQVAVFSVVSKSYPGYDPDNMGLVNVQALGVQGTRS